MSLPPIDPTGAMSSGDYVTYMIDYLGDAMTEMSDGLSVYLGDAQLQGWESLWNKQVYDLTKEVQDLSLRISKIRTNVRMASDAISKL